VKAFGAQGIAVWQPSIIDGRRGIKLTQSAFYSYELNLMPEWAGSTKASAAASVVVQTRASAR